MLKNIALESVEEKPKVIIGSIGTLVTQALNVAYDKKAQTTEKTEQQKTTDAVATESQVIDQQLAAVRQLDESTTDTSVYYQYNPVVSQSGSEEPSVSSVMNQLACIDDCAVPKEIIYYVDSTETGVVGDATPTANGYSKDELKSLAVESISVVIKLKKA